MIGEALATGAVWLSVLVVLLALVGCDAPGTTTVYDEDGRSYEYRAIPDRQEVVEIYPRGLVSMTWCTELEVAAGCQKRCVVVDAWNWECAEESIGRSPLDHARRHTEGV
jgi:hypothetical protein